MLYITDVCIKSLRNYVIYPEGRRGKSGNSLKKRHMHSTPLDLKEKLVIASPSPSHVCQYIRSGHGIT